MRNLVSIKTISAIDPIPNADAIEVATIEEGWQCVVKKAEFKVGDRCVYFEVDSFVDHKDPRFAFLEKAAIKWNGLEGARIKTIRLRGQVSQGLALPVDQFKEELESADRILHTEDLANDEEAYPYGVLAHVLNVTKWEKLYSNGYGASLGGNPRGNFPYFIQKTDQERLQNMFRKVAEDTETLYEVSMKLDGSSGTFYLNDDVFGACSRNLDLAEYEVNQFWKIARQYDLERILRYHADALAIQGEVYGAGVNGNWENLPDVRFAIFDIWDIKERRYWGSNRRLKFCEQYELPHVPVLELAKKFPFKSIQEAVDYAEGPSLFNKIREGVVWKAMDGSKSFKIINPSFLLSGGN